MRFYILVALLAFAAPCEAQDISQRQYNALTAWINCEKRAARQLDDGYSDPLSVGVALDSACARLKQTAFAIETENMNYIGESTARPQFEAMAMKAATEIVMRHRKGLD